MAPVIEFLRVLRDRTHAAAGFVHHTGHGGSHMRGSSDLESVWETRLAWQRSGQSPVVTIEAEHREAEAGDPISYRIGWDAETRTMRFTLDSAGTEPSPAEKKKAAVLDFLHRQREPVSRSMIVEGVTGRKADVLAAITLLVKEGTAHEDNGRVSVPVPGSHPKGWGNREPQTPAGSGNRREPTGTGNQAEGLAA